LACACGRISASTSRSSSRRSTGPEGYNEKLGLARAEAVRRYLADQHQVEVTKITVVSYGERQPAVPNDTRDGRAQNRRVVIKVTH
jgi:outer membrane protein OmpA-like peptidoglycan-associated protein